MYQCRNSEGETTFRDTPCEKAEATVRTEELAPREPESQTPPIESSAPGAAGSYRQAANLAQALSSLTPTKMLVSEYYLINGRWPGNLEQLGLDSRSMHNQQISRVTLLPGGGIRAALSELFGSGKRLTLRPKEAMGGTQLEWSCKVNLPAATLARMYGSACSAEN